MLCSYDLLACCCIFFIFHSLLIAFWAALWVFKRAPYQRAVTYNVRSSSVIHIKREKEKEWKTTKFSVLKEKQINFFILFVVELYWIGSNVEGRRDRQSFIFCSKFSFIYFHSLHWTFLWENLHHQRTNEWIKKREENWGEKKRVKWLVKQNFCDFQ